MRLSWFRLGLLALIAFGMVALRCPYIPGPWEIDQELAGLGESVRVVTDELGVAHVYATDDADAARVVGYVHARDRFFQMDMNRRLADGTVSELIGLRALQNDLLSVESDGQTRPLDLRHAAGFSEDLLTVREREILEAYADGVNAYRSSHPLPPEYAELRILTVPEWTVLDTLLVTKVLGAGFDLGEPGNTTNHLAYIAAGEAHDPPYDGFSLFAEDVARWAPMAPASTVPDATGGCPFATPGGPSPLLGATGGVDSGPASTPRQPAAGLGSNAWGVAAAHSENGRPMLANDPHVGMGVPNYFYPVHIVVEEDPQAGDLDVAGFSLPGIPFPILGHNPDVGWVITDNPADHDDLFEDRLVYGDPGCAVDLCIDSAGALHPVEPDTESYFVNFPVEGVWDNLIPLPPLLPREATTPLRIPFRSRGPATWVDDWTVVDGAQPPGSETTIRTLQYTGLHGGREVSALLAFARARDVFEFREAVRLFNTVSLNFVVADAAGDLAYFTSGEIPLRADLEAGTVADVPPDFLRDGSGPGNWIPDPARPPEEGIPFEVLPFEEMPQAINPANGFLVSANNDPCGTTADNDPVNQMRAARPGSIYYLVPYTGSISLRAEQITRLLTEKIDAGETLSVADMQAIQNDSGLVDAALMLPFLEQARANAEQPGAPAELAAWLADPEVVEALDRLAAWDTSTPTGIPEGYDPSDSDGERLAVVPAEEISNSIAATIYAFWRKRVIVGVDQVVSAHGAPPGFLGRFALAGLHNLLDADPFTGVGASGVDFFPEPAALAAEDRRDIRLLEALREALDELASPSFAAAFGGSTDQDDYHWGRLARLVLEHPLGAGYNVPESLRFEHLAPQLDGVARSGGWESISPTGNTVKPGNPDDFMTLWGSLLRRVVTVDDSGRMASVFSMVGGVSGHPQSPYYDDRLGKWLTGDYDPLWTDPSDVDAHAVDEQQFVPPVL